MNMEEAEMLADEILTAAGTSLKHYMPMSKTKIIEAAKSWQEMVDSVNDTNRVLLNKIKVLEEKCGFMSAEIERISMERPDVLGEIEDHEETMDCAKEAYNIALEDACALVHGWCSSDNVAERTVREIRKLRKE